MKIKFIFLFFICVTFVNCGNNTFASSSNQVVAISSVKNDSFSIKAVVLDSIDHPDFRSDTILMNEEFPLLVFKKNHKPSYYLIAEEGENEDYILRLFVGGDNNKWQQQDTLVVKPYENTPNWLVQDLDKDGIDDVWFMTDSHSIEQKVYEILSIKLNPIPKIVSLSSFLTNPRYLKDENLIEGESYNGRKELFRKSYYHIKGDKLELIKEVKVKTSND